MLTITVPAVDEFNEITQQFIMSSATVLQLEHSLVSLSKWEATWNKPFLGPKEKTTEEAIGYIKAMSLDPDIPSEVYQRLSVKNFEEINEYISAKMTATWFNELPTKKGLNREIVTSELIYYWMSTLNVPIDFQHWHLNRLFTYIEVCNRKNQPEKKMSKADLMNRNRAINEARQAQYKTEG